MNQKLFPSNPIAGVLMTNKQKLALLEELFDAEVGSLQPTSFLEDIEQWDSINKLSLIILMDEEFGKAIDGNDLKKLITVGDILELMGES
ncbi:MAG: acyl carrier protein [Deltaproteobacteria bacterium]|jgi:acyl carrier protein|nr:acyl carrier protein [Deltaproteobacteria bacterium]